MEDLAKDISRILSLSDQLVEKWEAEFQGAMKELDMVLKGPSHIEVKNSFDNTEQTPQQIKKRTKRISISDDEYNQTAKSLQNFNNRRPTRTAKANITSMKEPDLTTKIRRPSNLNTINVKKERLSNDSNESKNKKKISNELDNDKPMETNSTISSLEKESNIRDESLSVIKNENPVVIIPEFEVMPPPAAAPKKRVRAGNKQKHEDILDLNQILKKEKQSLAASDLDSLNNNELINSKTGKSIRQKKLRNVPKPIIVKEERISTIATDVTVTTTKSSRNGSFESVYEDARAMQPESSHSLQSVNNEILDACNKKNSESNLTVTTHSNGPFISQKIDKPKKTTEVKNVADATFKVGAQHIRAAESIAVILADATFNAGVHQTTFTVDEHLNGTKIIGTNCDQTFDVLSTTAVIEQSHLPLKSRNLDEIRQSIMTEDNSFEEDKINRIRNVTQEKKVIPMVKYKPKPKCKINELFNPCVQSPLKKKVEAFEKVSSQCDPSLELASSQTTVKTRANKAKENDDPDNNKEYLKALTPNIGRQIGRLLTPQQTSSTITPTLGKLVTKKMPNSTSKTIGLQKSLSSNKITPSHSRENSSEDIKRNFAKFQQMAEERKKQKITEREQKQQKAAEIRENKEKERTEKLKKVIEEREEKARKKAAESEKEKARMLEEINRKVKIQEEKKKNEKKLQRERDLELTRPELEMLDNQKIQQSKFIMQQKRQQNQEKTKLKFVRSAFNFNMLCSDDSTDEEDKKSTKRPSPPEWSISQNRSRPVEIQQLLHTDIVDSFFSVKPMTPDLTEMFPNIDKKYLKRNSSAIWNTPPRYSQLPKH